MNKQQALTELAALKERADALEKIINAPEPTPSLLDKPEPGSGQPYYAHGSIFADRATAEAYAEAIDTLLLLRHQPGTVAALQSVDQWLIDPQTGSLYPRSSAWPRSDTKATRLSPCFETWEAAEAAIKAIGADRIMRMFKTFHHIKG